MNIKKIIEISKKKMAIGEQASLKLIDGEKIASEIKQSLREKISRLKVEKNLIPDLAVIFVGDDAAGKSYAIGKERACEQVGIYSSQINLPKSTTEEELLNVISVLNRDDEIHGILVQLPLPSHIRREKISEAILPSKDVDGMTSANLGKLVSGQKCFIPCTSAAIVEILKHEKIDLSRKRVTIIGRSDIIGKPLVYLLSSKEFNATVCWCNSKTRREDLKKLCKESQVIISATGRHGIIPVSWISQDTVVIDVGVNAIKDLSRPSKFRVVGDIYDSSDKRILDYLAKSNILVTPVPGGVGPMTTAMLLSNVFESAVNLSK